MSKVNYKTAICANCACKLSERGHETKLPDPDAPISKDKLAELKSILKCGDAEMKKEIKFVFDNEESADYFLSWLCESGEQGYWQWMECREEEEEGNITVLKFDYHNGTGKANQFGKGDIVCKSGRMDVEWK